MLVENEEDAAVFKDLQDPGTAAKPVEKQVRDTSSVSVTFQCQLLLLVGGSEI